MYEALRYENIGAHSLTGTNVAGSFELRQSSTPMLAWAEAEEVDVEVEAQTEGGSSGWYNRAKP